MNPFWWLPFFFDNHILIIEAWLKKDSLETGLTGDASVLTPWIIYLTTEKFLWSMEKNLGCVWKAWSKTYIYIQTGIVRGEMCSCDGLTLKALIATGTGSFLLFCFVVMCIIYPVVCFYELYAKIGGRACPHSN